MPDFMGSWEALKTVLNAEPDVLNHNIESVTRLFPRVRPKGRYDRSIELLAEVKQLSTGIVTKSGIILGMGETKDEVLETMEDLRRRRLKYSRWASTCGPRKSTCRWTASGGRKSLPS